ncbi:MAG TPA: hypothetical protein VFQ40_04825 [Actinomycetota bacterium]|nr:hypothetical protein [Actinomycetota bacterium]
MSDIDLWRIYGSRQDTDACIIRELERDRTEAVRNAEDARRTIDAIHKALHKVGLSIAPPGGRFEELNVKIAEQAYEDGPLFTKEMANSLVEVARGELAFVEIVRTDDQQP